MSEFVDGRIFFDEERDIYYAGQVMNGKLEFTITQPLQFKAINLLFHGAAEVSWEENEVEEYNGERRCRTVQYGSEEVFYHFEQCVCGGVGVSQLQSGKHVIPFQFQIPSTVPSSFEDDDEERSISYYVRGILEYHDGREKEELENEYFDVVVPLDLNDNPEMQTENEVIFEEVMSSFFCGSGLLKLVFTLPATGFCPGQNIPISVKADNRSSVEVTKIMFELVRRVKYFSTDPPSKKEEPETSLHRTKTGAIPAKTRRNFTHNFEIPDLIAVVTQNCNIIKVAYFFKVKVILSGCNDDLEDDIEICLGLIPIRDMVDDDYKHPLQSDLPKGPIPRLGEPPAVIKPYLYPSETIHVVHAIPVINNMNPNVSAHPQNFAPPGGYPYPGNSPNMASPYPGSNAPYQSNPGYPPPYPGNDSAPYPGGPAPGAPVIGFVAPGYPPASAEPTSYKPSAPPE